MVLPPFIVLRTGCIGLPMRLPMEYFTLRGIQGDSQQGPFGFRRYQRRFMLCFGVASLDDIMHQYVCRWTDMYTGRFEASRPTEAKTKKMKCARRLRYRITMRQWTTHGKDPTTFQFCYACFFSGYVDHSYVTVRSSCLALQCRLTRRGEWSLLQRNINVSKRTINRAIRGYHNTSPPCSAAHRYHPDCFWLIRNFDVHCGNLKYNPIVQSLTPKHH